MANIILNVCLSDLPREFIKDVTLKDGTHKKYINLVVGERKSADSHGNDHLVKVYVPKDKRESHPNPIYVGNGKTQTYNGNSSTENSPTSEANNARGFVSGDGEDLPF